MKEVQRTHFIAGATPRELFDIVTDYEHYPNFFPEFTRVRVLAREGAQLRVEFRAKMVKEVRYTLAITHEEGPTEFGTRWTFVDGQIVSDSRGSWRFRPEAGGTRIEYQAGIDVRAPLPGFILNRITEAILGKSIPNMFQALERESAARRKR
ncbi:MAG TPA: SRPBCC family protein [Polyangia bacterium]|nr:SRPBCC family protein [Polyangia bacterium]